MNKTPNIQSCVLRVHDYETNQILVVGVFQFPEMAHDFYDKTINRSRYNLLDVLPLLRLNDPELK